MGTVDRNVTLVSGYIRNVDRLDHEAVKLGLPTRLAVVLHTFRPDKGYMFFDSALFLDVIGAVATAIPHSSLRMSMDQEDKKMFSSLDDLCGHYSITVEEDREPFYRAYLYRDGEPVCFIQTEFFVLVGGPQPYSDSYTLELYSGAADAQRLHTACREACAKAGARVAAEITGLPQPQISLWARLKGLLR